MMANNGGANEIWEYLGSGTHWTDLITDPVSDVGYSLAPSGVQLFNSGGPSYLDVEEGVRGDCRLLASLAEVADRDPQVIQNMFVSDGTTVVNGATVGVYPVKFFSNTGIAFDLKVDSEFPAGGNHFRIASRSDTSFRKSARSRRVSSSLSCFSSATSLNPAATAF